MARCHSGKYFAGAVAAGPRPPAAVGAPGDPGDGASSQLPLPRSCSEAASIDTAPGHPRRGRATAPAAGDSAVPLHGDPPVVPPRWGLERCPRCPSVPAWNVQLWCRALPWGMSPRFPRGKILRPVGFSRGENLQKLGKSQGRWAQPWVKTQPPTPGIPGAAAGGGGDPRHTGDGMFWDACVPTDVPRASREWMSLSLVAQSSRGGGNFAAAHTGVGASVPLSSAPPSSGDTQAQGTGTHMEPPVPVPSQPATAAGVPHGREGVKDPPQVG